MKATLEKIPQTGKLSLTIEVSADINYSADAARRLVGRFIANEISYLLRCADCLAACAAMVLEYLERPVVYPRLLSL